MIENNVKKKDSPIAIEHEFHFMSDSIMVTPTCHGPIEIVTKYHVSLYTSLTHYTVEAK